MWNQFNPAQRSVVSSLATAYKTLLARMNGLTNDDYAQFPPGREPIVRMPYRYDEAHAWGRVPTGLFEGALEGQLMSFIDEFEKAGIRTAQNSPPDYFVEWKESHSQGQVTRQMSYDCFSGAFSSGYHTMSTADFVCPQDASDQSDCSEYTGTDTATGTTGSVVGVPYNGGEDVRGFPATTRMISGLLAERVRAELGNAKIEPYETANMFYNFTNGEGELYYLHDPFYIGIDTSGTASCTSYRDYSAEKAKRCYVAARDYLDFDVSSDERPLDVQGLMLPGADTSDPRAVDEKFDQSVRLSSMLEGLHDRRLAAYYGTSLEALRHIPYPGDAVMSTPYPRELGRAASMCTPRVLAGCGDNCSIDPAAECRDFLP